ncbi:MAG TPA: orotidine-5'-phosphate decarboxylase [Candidatus Acidoferrum sp.]|nr:orotidine-5'-phosphate decarboxylase [Candidatus Acidoferrum sp.]
MVALDFDHLAPALELAGKLAGIAGVFKIGKQLFTAEGPEAVRRVSQLGPGVFLDLKYHDIPNTVVGAVRAAAAIGGVRLVNIHALGGPKMMAEAAAALKGIPNAPKLLGVTILTSTDAKTMAAVGISGTPGSRALRLAKLAKKSGLDGVVASAHEVKAIKKACGKNFIVLVGGVRPDSGAVARGAQLRGGLKRDDQSRMATPAGAVRAGADYLVVGRPITGAADPVAAALAIAEEIARAEAE